MFLVLVKIIPYIMLSTSIPNISNITMEILPVE